MTSIQQTSQNPLTSSTLSRRRFLTRTAGGAATLGLVTLGGGGIAWATPDAPKAGDAIVQIFLRGGADGLSMLPPFGYESYRKLRPNLAIPKPGAENGALRLTTKSSGGNATFSGGLEGVVGLHPQFKPIHDTLWKEGTLALITGVGTDEKVTRSHFAAQDLWERGTAQGNIGTGYLGRMLAVQQSDLAISAASMGKSRPRSLTGDPSGSVTIPDLSAVGLVGFNHQAEAEAALQGMYRPEATNRLRRTGGRALQVQRLLEPLSDSASALNGYPGNEFGLDLRDAALLLTSGLGVRSITIDVGGWDHHKDHGAPGSGRYWGLAGLLAAGLRRFTDDLKSTGAYAETTIVVITEFGRTINENGNLGLDHGRAGSMMLMGGGIKGGVYGYDYYDEIKDDPTYGDLTVLTDWRDPMSEVLAKRAGVDPEMVFPNFKRSSKNLGVARR